MLPKRGANNDSHRDLIQYPTNCDVTKNLSFERLKYQLSQCWDHASSFHVANNMEFLQVERKFDTTELQVPNHAD